MELSSLLYVVAPTYKRLLESHTVAKKCMILGIDVAINQWSQSGVRRPFRVREPLSEDPRKKFGIDLTCLIA